MRLSITHKTGMQISLKTLAILILLLCISALASAQCVGSVSTISIPRNIGCSFGTGGNATWDGASGGTISDPGGSASDFTVTWTTTGTFRLKRVFPGGCTGTPLYSSYFTIVAKPATPTVGEVNQQPGCGQVVLNYTGSVFDTYWQTSATGTDITYRTTKTLTTAGTYYARIKNSTGCWGDGRSITVTTIPAAPVGGTLAGGSGTYYGTFNKNLTLTGKTGNVKEYRYKENGGSDVVVANTTTTLPVSFSNSTGSSINRQYWAVIELGGCQVNSSSTTITINGVASPSLTVCVGQTTNHSITRNISCTGSNATFALGSGGTINDPGGSASAFTVTWTTPGTYTLKRTFPSPCNTEIAGETVLVLAQPAMPAVAEVNQQAGCGQVILNYTGSVFDTYWQTSAAGTDLTFRATKTLTTAGTYYARIKNSSGCWSDGRTIVVTTIPGSPVGGTLSGGSGTYYGSFNKTLTLTGNTGTVKEYRYKENGGSDVVVANTTTTLNVSFSNSTASSVNRQYWAVIELNGCQVNSSSTTITINGVASPSLTVCVGQTTNHSITRNISCTGSNATFALGSGGTINDPGGSESAFTVTWTTPGTYTLKRTFPSPCNTEVAGETVLVLAQPAMPAVAEVNQQAGCGQVILNYTGSVFDTYWQTSAAGTDLTFRTTKTLTAAGTYYARIKNSNGCWSDGRSIVVSTIPGSPVGGTLSGGSGTYFGSFNKTLTLTGNSGTVKEYRYKENGGSEVVVANTTTSLPINFSNSTSAQIAREYWAVVQLSGCQVNSASTMITINGVPATTLTVCVGQTTNHSITRNISCTGSNATFAVGNGGTINDPGGSATAFSVTWTTPGVYTLKRTFPSPCNTEIAGETVLVNPKPATLYQTDVLNVLRCNGIYLLYTGTLDSYWQTTASGTNVDKPLDITVTTAGNYYLRIKSPLNCWSDPLQYSITSLTLNAPCPIVDFPDVSNTCSSQQGYVILTSNKTTDRWFQNATLGTALSGTNSIEVPVTVNTYYVETTSSKGQVFRIPYTIDPTFTSRCGEHLNSISSYKPSKELTVLTLQESAVDLSKAITYFDGTGRSVQEISVKGSPLQKDVVRPVVYDLNGREFRKYLPFVSPEDNGAFKSITFSALGNYTHNFYNNPSDKIADDTYPFAETIFEASPLNRPLKDFGAGEGWRIPGNEKFTENQYLINVHGTGVNTSAEKVISWKLNASAMPVRSTAAMGLVETNGFFSSNQLTITVTLDEQRNVVREYINKLGQLVLKKVQIAGTGISNLNSTTDWALTYYLYDDFGNLRYVFQPELSKSIHNSDTYVVDSNGNDLNNFAFQYKYDGRKRMTGKRIPGSDWVYMVYDNRDRLVMTQDGNQRTLSPKQWTFTKYDVLNRPVLTGRYQSNSNLTTIQSVINNYYQNLTTSTAWFETYIGSATGNVLGYDNKSFPQLSVDSDYRTATYYDSYDSFIAPAGFTYTVETPAIAGQEASGNVGVKGLVTGTQVRNLTWGSWMRTLNYYDAKYRLIQTVSDRFKGKLRTTNILDFPGRILVSMRTYVVSSTTTTVKETFTYDHASRLLNVKHSVNGTPDVMIAKNTYNEIGQLVDKQLHSMDFTNFKQSVDYRYNIRGWLTSMNNANLTADASNDDTNDYFGMNLSYNTIDVDLGNNQLYNGNISAMKWSNYNGTSTTKPKGYTYTYDAMNRISGSTFKEKTTSWTAPANNGFAEMGYTYDLNGNLLTLQRNDKRGTGWMDNLVYNYGTGASKSNRLLRVEDTGDDYAGFIDGNPSLASDFTTTNDDYRYDANGNVINDRNKGIGTSVNDNTNIITYNFLNLPETITKGGNNVRYLYDASGTKLAQIVTTGTTTKQTDYIDELTYENDVLQSINHAEGRIMMASTKLIYADHGESTSTITANLGAVNTLVTQNGSEKYVKITSSANAGNGAFPIGGTFNVSAGERYRIRVKGYRNSTGTKDVYVLIKANGTNVNWPGAKLPTGVVSESWIEQIVTIPWLTGGLMPLQVGVVWDAATSGEVMFINEVEITKLGTSTPEYQYNLKDHLGNVRLTFTATPETDCGTATLETANAATERSQFVRYDNARIVNHYLFDRTNGVAPTTTAGGAQRLAGGTNEKYGLARSLSVMPGDVINMEVYGKYIDSNTANLTAALSALVSQIAGGTAPGGTVIDGGGYGSSTSSFPFAGGLNGTSGSSGTGPKAYLNWIVFDRNYVLIPGKSGYMRMTTAAREYGQDVAHERLFGSITVDQPGYVYVYLSNEETTNPYEVYFDAFSVCNIKSPVIQTDDYYPFGLTYNSYTRENATPQDYKYNGKEEQTELGLGWLDYGARMYDPLISRWLVTDPLSEKYFMVSPYVYVANSPNILTDPDGREISFSYQYDNNGMLIGVTINVTGKLINNSSRNLSAKQLEKRKDRILKGLSNVKINGSENFAVKVVGDIQVVNSESQISKTDHVFRLVDDIAKVPGANASADSNPEGFAPFGQNVVYLENDFTARTGAHEVLHSAGLKHIDESNEADFSPTSIEYLRYISSPNSNATNCECAGSKIVQMYMNVYKSTDFPGNIMHRGVMRDSSGNLISNPNVGNKVTKGQVDRIVYKIQNGQINGGSQK